MEINDAYKAFLGVSWLFLISSAFTLAKTLRDRHAGGGHDAAREGYAHRRRALGNPIAECLALAEVRTGLGEAAYDLFDDDRPGDAASSRRVARIFDGHVVVHEYRRAMPVANFGGHFEVHGVSAGSTSS